MMNRLIWYYIEYFCVQYLNVLFLGLMAVVFTAMSQFYLNDINFNNILSFLFGIITTIMYVYWSIRLYKWTSIENIKISDKIKLAKENKKKAQV